MPKCNKCPLRKECNKLGKLNVTVTDDKGKKKKAKLCPILFAVNAVIKRVVNEAQKQSEGG